MKKIETVSKEQFDEVLEALFDVIWQDCQREETITLKGGKKLESYFDSIAISSYAEAMRILAKHGKLKIISEYARRVIATEVKIKCECKDSCRCNCSVCHKCLAKRKAPMTISFAEKCCKGWTE